MGIGVTRRDRGRTNGKSGLGEGWTTLSLVIKRSRAPLIDPRINPARVVFQTRRSHGPGVSHVRGVLFCK